MGWDMVGNCIFCAPVVIGSKDVFFFMMKSREGPRTSALSGCCSSSKS